MVSSDFGSTSRKMISAVQLCAMVVVVVATVGVILDMMMNGARYASGAWVVVLCGAGFIWWIADVLK